jgi:hypothetical protein
MTDLVDPKDALLHTLQAGRDALLWKLDGLSERELRLPRTPTGTNLLGIVKHCLNVEVGYFGPTFGREWPTPDELVPMSAYDSDPQADWYATAGETAAGLVDLYRRVWAFADETVRTLPLDTVGRVPWWREGAQEATLLYITVHVIEDIARHAGHADILREQVDGDVGMDVVHTNIPDLDWPAYVARLQALADRFA